MKRKTHLAVWIVVVCVSMVTAEYGSDCVDVAVSEKGRYLLSSVGQIDTLPGSDVIQCISSCKQKQHCKSINFKIDSKTCTLLSGTKSSRGFTLQEKKEYLHYELRKVNTLTDRTRLSKKELKERRSSPVNSCSKAHCLHNATCEEVCGKQRYKCHCRESNYDATCSGWKAEFSDFDLFFPRGNSEDYVTQQLKETKYGHNYLNKQFSVSFWMRPDKSLSDKEKITVVSFVAKGKTQLVVQLNRLDLEVEFGVDNLRSLGKSFTIEHKYWTFVSIFWKCYERYISVKVHGEKTTQSHSQKQLSSTKPLNTKDLIVVVGRRLDSDPGYSFKGKITRLNIMKNEQEYGRELETKAGIAWPMFWDFYGPVISGAVVQLPYSEHQRVWENVPSASFSYNVHGNGLQVTMGTDTAQGYLIRATLSPSCDSVSFLSIHVRLNTTRVASPKKIRYRLKFDGQTLCYGIFGGSLAGTGPLEDTGLYPFDSTKDMLQKNHNMREPSEVNDFRSPLSGCGEDHFLYPRPVEPKFAASSQRVRPGSKQLIIRSFFKCGTGNLELDKFRLMY